MVPPPCDSSGLHAAPDTIAGAVAGAHPNSVVNAAPDNRDTTDARDLSPSRQRAKKCETKIVLLRLQAESPLLPIKEDAASNINHISVKSAANHHHLPYSACADDYQSPAHLTPGKRSVDIFLTPPTSCPPTPTSPAVFGTPSSECRRRSSITSLHRFEGIIPGATTAAANGYATPTTDGLHPDTSITIVDHGQNNNNNNKIKNINNNNNTPLYSNYNYNKPNAAHSPHSHDYNLYPNDTFERLAGPPPKVQTKMQSKVDAVGRVTGEWGRWQLRTVLLIFLVKIPSSWFMACIIFTAPAPRHGEFFCKPPHTVGAQNQTQWIKVSHPQKEEVDDQEFAIDFCNVYQDAQEHAHRYYHYDRPELEPKLWEEPEARSDNIIPCTQFQHEADFHSIVTQYDLVCSRDILVSVTQFFHLFGVLTGGILANHLLKYFSPRYVMLFGMVTQIFCGNLTGHVSSYELHVFFRCLSAVCCAQMYTAGGMIMADITGGKYKTCVSTLFEQFWSIGVIMLPGVASFFSSWSHLYMAISWPTVILIYLWQWIPDSPRWMISRGRVLDAKKILLECADVNGTRANLPRDIDQQLELQAQTAVDAPPPSGWWSLWKGEKAVRHIVCVHLAWSIYIVVYYGMLLNIRSFSRDHLEINTVVAGLCEIIGTFIGLFLILKTTRKWVWTGLFNVIAGFIAFLGWLVPDERQIDFDARVALLMLSAMISKTAISTTLSILTTCTVELVSDDKKKICAFSTICWARFWLLGAPFIGATLIFGQLVPQTAFAALAIIGGVLTALISSPRTISKQKSTRATSNMATATQFSSEADIGVGIYNKGFANGTNNPIFTSITKLSAPHSNLPPQMMPGIWTTKNHEDCPPI